jgi:methionyl-tRNA formyltransferase
VRGDLVARPQSTIGMTLTRPLRREDGRLDPTCPTDVLERQVRAYQPWPGSFVDTVAGRLVVWASRIGPVADGSPGLFVADGLVTGDGRLLLDDVQPAGGRRMSWDEFLRGRPSIVGSHIVPGP